FLSSKASKARLREAENARKNRAEIIQALSHRQVTRRELVKWGLLTAGGLWVPIHGLSPFARSAYADNIPTGAPPSPLFGAQPFSQPLYRFDVLQRHAEPGFLNPAPVAQVDEKRRHRLDTRLEGVRPGDTGPDEGRPPGPIWAHQDFDRYPPEIAVEVTQEGAKNNDNYDPDVPARLNNGIDKNNAGSMPVKFYQHPDPKKAWPTQAPLKVWTFNGTIPPKLLIGRYGEPILFRHRNKLPYDIKQNGGFGIHTISTHEHNGHHGAENDGFTGAWFYPGQFYDYHYPIVLAGLKSINTGATDPRAGSPTDDGHIDNVPGDWHETMSTHWFHDHMYSYTSQNV